MNPLALICNVPYNFYKEKHGLHPESYRDEPAFIIRLRSELCKKATFRQPTEYGFLIMHIVNPAIRIYMLQGRLIQKPDVPGMGFHLCFGQPNEIFGRLQEHRLTVYIKQQQTAHNNIICNRNHLTISSVI